MKKKFKDTKVGQFLKKRGRDIASGVLDVLPLPNVLNFIPDRNKDGKRDLKDLKWFELLAGVGFLAVLLKFEIVDFEPVMELLKLVLGY